MNAYEHNKRDHDNLNDTRLIPEFRMCVFHLAHEKQIEKLEKACDEIWRAINTMRAWVIAGCGAMIMCLIGVIFQVLTK
jgi:hypothetical protein